MDVYLLVQTGTGILVDTAVHVHTCIDGHMYNCTKGSIHTCTAGTIILVQTAAHSHMSTDRDRHTCKDGFIDTYLYRLEHAYLNRWMPTYLHKHRHLVQTAVYVRVTLVQTGTCILAQITDNWICIHLYRRAHAYSHR
jgi:hypothetical protein